MYMLGGNNTKPFESHSENSDSKTSVEYEDEYLFIGIDINLRFEK